jgi:hypothetical protein
MGCPQSECGHHVGRILLLLYPISAVVFPALTSLQRSTKVLSGEESPFPLERDEKAPPH